MAQEEHLDLKHHANEIDEVYENIYLGGQNAANNK